MLTRAKSFFRRNVGAILGKASSSPPQTQPAYHVKRGVIAQIVGGLANQMICYKLGRFIADTTSRTLILDGTFYKAQPENSNRNLQLLYHDIAYDLFYDSYEFASSLTENRTITNIAGEQFHDFHNESRKKLAAELIQSDADFIFIDIWGSLTLRELADQYALEHNVFAELRLDTDKHLDETNKRILTLIQASPNPTAIHVRRGDYASHAGGMLLQSKYYNNAIQQIESQVKEPHFFVFSDDIPWCRENLCAANLITFVDCNDERHGYRDLSLASNCKHFIMSSLSTFSHQILELNVESPGRLVLHSTDSDLDH